MSNKTIFLGSITLLLFPIIGYLIRYFVDGISIIQFLDFKAINIISIGYGLEFGLVYGFIALLFMNALVFHHLENRMERLVKSMNLKIWHGIFLSLCAAIGEEYLFRMGIQPYLGVWVTSIGFIALHGYLNPFNWRFSLYGLIALPFITLLSLGYESFGIFFAIAAHFSYDALLFTALISGDDAI